MSAMIIIFIAITILSLLVTLYYGLRGYTCPEIFSAMVTIMAFIALIYFTTMSEI